jgi:hypothetical protein
VTITGTEDDPIAANKAAAERFMRLIVAGLIVELWDMGPAIPVDSPNVDGAF